MANMKRLGNKPEREKMTESCMGLAIEAIAFIVAMGAIMFIMSPSWWLQ